MGVILIILPTLPSYRIDFFNLLNEKLKKINYKLIVISGSNISNKKIIEIKDAVFELIKCKTSGYKIFGYNLQWQKSLIYNVKMCCPDKVIMLYNAGNINFNMLLLYLRYRKIKYILWGCGHVRDDLSKGKHKIKSFIKSFFVKNSAAYITYGSDFKKSLISDGYNKNKIFVAQNTLNVEGIFNNSFNKLDVRTYSPVKFLFVGALIRQKNLKKVLNACHILKSNNKNFIFNIVGDGILKDELINMSKELSLTDNVTFHSAKYGNELSHYFISSNVFILPGDGGLALNEAMAYSLPVISTPADGTPFDLIEESKNGYMLPVNYSVEELAEKMSNFINADKNTLINMGNESLKIIKEKATLNNMVNKFMECINHA
jgi:glycosyltransferase involved in cell wall biosynthesis